MKQYLLLLGFSLSLSATQAQSIQPAPLRQPFDLPAEVQQKLKVQDLASQPTAARATTVRKPRRATTYNWQANQQWSTNGTVELFTYDAQARITQIVEQDSATQQPSTLYSFAYNAAGRQASYLIQVWTGTSWQNETQSRFVYNSAGYLTENVEEQWKNGAWQSIFRLKVAYDFRNHYVGWSNEAWQNNTWVVTAAGRTLITYTAAGAVLQETEETLEPSKNIYLPGPRRQYGYPTPTSMQYNSRIDQQWVNGAYINQQRLSNVQFDSQGRETYSESEMWENNAWVLRSRFSTSYQPNGTTLGLLEQRVGNAWVPGGRFSHAYDDFGTELSYVGETWTNNAWEIFEAYRYLVRYNAAHDLLARVRQNYNTSTKAYENSLKHIFGDFQSITLAVRPNAAVAAETQLYPNPTTGAVQLELPAMSSQASISAEVINSLGQVVQRLTLRPAQNRTTLDLGAQQPGVYSVRLHTAAGLVVKKVVRQ